MKLRPSRSCGLFTRLPSHPWLGCSWWAAVSLFCASLAHGDSLWSKAGSGGWMETAAWTGGLPSAVQAVSIENSGSKTVLMDAATPAVNRVIRRLTLAAPAGSTNLLRLSNVVGQPLLSSNSVNVGVGGRLEILSSELVVDGAAGGSLTSLGGDIELNGGLLGTRNGARSRVGREGVGSLVLKAGLFANGSDLIVGGLINSVGRMNLDGGTSTVAGVLILGDDAGALGELRMRGGTLIATNATVRLGDDGQGLLVISNGLAHFGDVSVGRSSNSIGRLELQGGTLVSGDLSVGRFPGAKGQMTIGGGNFLAPDDSLYVGRDGTGELAVQGGEIRVRELVVGAAAAARGSFSLSGGRVLVSSNWLVGATSGVVATATLLGGQLSVTNASRSARVELGRGSLDLNGASLTVDQLWVTGTQAAFQLNRGTLAAGQIDVNNGKPFVVGDGSGPATLQLNGGTYRFPQGLVVNSQATLTGCGTIIGPITVRPGGANRVSCGGPELGALQISGGGFRFSFQGNAGVIYTVEYTDRLQPAVWRTLRTVSGTGGAMTVQDPLLVPGSRFYRLTSSQP